MNTVRFTGFLVLLLVMVLTSSTQLAAKTRSIQVTARTVKGETIDLYSGSYALVVGNGNYSKGWDPLPGAIRDVEEVAEVLSRNGFKVTLKKDLTRADFNRVLGEFVLQHGGYENNRLLFYYAGHGHTKPMATGEQLGYLVMVNAPVPEKDPLGFDLSSVDMQTLVTQAKMIRAKHVLFMFDSCFSGTVLNLRERATPEVLSDKVRYPVRQFITAGRANEPVPDHSVFKQAFLDLLEGRAREPIPDGYITGEELGLYLKNTVPEYNPAQHPQYGKIRDPRLDKGDFVFVRMDEPVPPRSEPDQTKSQVKELEQRLQILEQQLDKKGVDKEPPQPKENVATLTHGKKNKSAMQNSAVASSRPKPVQATSGGNLLPQTQLALLKEEHHRVVPQYEERYTLAVFPWVERRQAGIHRAVVLSALNQAIDVTQVFLPLYSYYDLKNEYGTSVIDNLMANYPAKELFTKPKFFSNAEPKIDLISQLGGELDVDAVLLGRVDISESHGRTSPLLEARYSMSIVDIVSKKQYSLRLRETVSSFYDLNTFFDSAFKRLFRQYRDGETKNQ